VHNFRRLTVWQRSRELALVADVLARKFPRSDRGVVANQLRRAALSIPANIAEGCGKSSRKEVIRFLQIASGSARETEHHLLMAADLGYLPNQTYERLAAEVKAIERMLAGLIARLPQ
jgi:four helix bundle protein